MTRPQPKSPAQFSEVVPSLRCSLPPYNGPTVRREEEHRRDGTASEKATTKTAYKMRARRAHLTPLPLENRRHGGLRPRGVANR
jgi:hypothetical protein